MRRISLLLCIVLCILLFAGCNSERYSITMADKDWLYEKIPTSAKAGETVTVKISLATDLGYLFLVNGEEIESTDGTSDYWIFNFTMPDEDVTIEFKTYDGFLPDANFGVLIETFWMQNPEAEYVSVRDYCGEYESGAIVAMIDAWDYTANVWSETVGGCEFLYGNGNRLQVLVDGKFYTLPEAYGNGYLTDADISAVYEKYRAAHAGAYENE